MTHSALPRVCVVYTHFPHYRQPVFDALTASTRFSFEFHYDAAGIEKTIVSGVSQATNHYAMRTRQLGPFQWQTKAVWLALRGTADAFIFLGNPFILSTWLAALIARLRGIPVFFWTHGWLRNETGLREQLRAFFYRLAHGLMLYGHRAKRLGLERGFASEKLHVIGNSLDYEGQARARDEVLSSPPKALSASLNKPYFLVVARLVESAGVDLAIAALARIEWDIALVIVGDGPQRGELEAQARGSGADIRFTGALYSEDELAPYFVHCAAVVSPGKVGLLAMHALAYGAAVITHRDVDRQMPEFEAIQEGVTGAFFEYGNIEQLASAMTKMIAHPLTEGEVLERRARAIATIERGFTPERQLEFIETALTKHDVGPHERA
ncbi:MAG: glycosyltransferase family 4 protein [Pseudomonadota bacterium]